MNNKPACFCSCFVIFLIMLLSFNYAWGQSSDATKAGQQLQVEDGKFTIANNLTFTLKEDENLIFSKLQFFSHGTLLFSDTLEITPYGIEFRLYDIDDRGTAVLIAAIVGEFVTGFTAYLISNSMITPLGPLNIALDCDLCDSWNYPVEEIVVYGTPERFWVKFNRNLRILQNGTYRQVNKDDVFLEYDATTGKLNWLEIRRQG